MPIVISSIPLRVGGIRVKPDTPVEISDADAESLRDYITIITDAVQEPADKESVIEESLDEEPTAEEPIVEDSQEVATPRGRPSRKKQ